METNDIEKLIQTKLDDAFQSFEKKLSSLLENNRVSPAKQSQDATSESSEIQMDSAFFSPSQPPPNRRTLDGNRMTIQSTLRVPDFKHSLEKLEILAIFKFFQAVKSYKASFPEADLHVQYFISNKVKVEIVGRQAGLTLESLELRDTDELENMIYALVKPQKPEEYMTAFDVLVSYVMRDINFDAKQLEAAAFEDYFKKLNVLIEAATSAYKLLERLTGASSHIRPRIRPESSRKGTSLIEKFETFIPIGYRNILFDMKDEAFRKARHDFRAYLKVYAEVNEELYSQIAPAAFWLNSVQASREESVRRTRVQNVSEDTLYEDLEWQLNQDVEELDVEMENSDNEISPIREAVSQVKFDSRYFPSQRQKTETPTNIKKPYKILTKKDDKQETAIKICWTHYKTGGKCNIPNCPYEHSREAMLRNKATQLEAAALW
jgi:hypothetical protein